MKKKLVPFSETHQFSPLVDDYLAGNDTLKPFYNLPPQLGSFQQAIENRKLSSENRKVLVDRVLNQYGNLLSSSNKKNEAVNSSIKKLLDEDTFTVTTGHQLNLFTGPLYSIFKIATTIKLAEELQKSHPQKKFVPVFWMASEDHDFAEINHTTIYGKNISWIREASGPAGRLKLDGFDSVLEEFNILVGDNLELVQFFTDAYLKSSNLAEATRKIIHHLFGKFGLVVIDGDDSGLKKLFVDEMKTDLLEQLAFNTVSAQAKTFGKNYKVQVTPREINLFYMVDDLRERIVNETGVFKVLNTELKFTKAEILEELSKHPERFSPNVVMRPLYQEKILPNLAYIGGPGELNYWLEFKSYFKASQINYPILLLRNCMMIVDQPTWAKFVKLNLEVKDIFQSADFLVLNILENSSDVHVGTETYAAVIQKTFSAMAETFAKLDPSLVQAIEGEKQKSLNGIKVIEEKGRRALKKKNETLVNQVRNLKEKLFPDGGLQERRDNFIPFYISYGEKFIDEILIHTDPFVKEFIVLIDE